MGRLCLGPMARPAFLAILAIQLSAGILGAQPPDAPLPADSSAVSPDLVSADGAGILDMDIEQLAKIDVFVPSMDIEVTSVAKEESTVGHSAAAIFVITNEMIRRSGVTSVPEVLRMVPGLEVARIESDSWAITSRGFNDHYANKLLVLIDGRSVYSTVFSGVWWDVQDLMLEDIERIEVIRGPGGTLWGANAVNGVINIISKTAQDTQGALVTYGAGTEDRSLGGVRYGGNNGQGLYWRIYGKHFERGTGYVPGGAHDDWRMGRAGFRVDWELDRCDCNKLTVQGDYYVGKEGHLLEETLPDPPYTTPLINNEGVSGANVLARWTHTTDEESNWSLQTYFDQTRRDEREIFDRLNTFDVEFQQRFPLGNRSRIIWGLDYRYVHDNMGESFTVGFDPIERTAPIFGGFVQDEITLVEDRLAFTIGTKLERNVYSGFECQPSARLLWTPDRRHSAWAAVSRAVHTPPRFHQDGWYNSAPVQFGGPFSPYIFPQVLGNPDLTSDKLMAYEIGYRAQVSEQFSFDVATFYNVYDGLVGNIAGDVYSDGSHLYLPLLFSNCMRGETYGVELLGQWTMSERWRLAASYSFLQMQLHSPASGTVVAEAIQEGSSPHNQAMLRSYWNLSPTWEFDVAVRYVDNLPAASVPSYITADVRLAWVPSEHFELAVVGQNLLDSHHNEFNTITYNAQQTEVERAVFAKATWQY